MSSTNEAEASQGAPLSPAAPEANSSAGKPSPDGDAAARVDPRCLPSTYLPSAAKQAVDALEFLTVKHIELQERIAVASVAESRVVELEAELERLQAAYRKLQEERSLWYGESLRFAEQMAEEQAAAAARHGKLEAYAKQLEIENTALRAVATAAGLVAPVLSASK